MSQTQIKWDWNCVMEVFRAHLTRNAEDFCKCFLDEQTHSYLKKTFRKAFLWVVKFGFQLIAWVRLKLQLYWYGNTLSFSIWQGFDSWNSFGPDCFYDVCLKTQVSRAVMSEGLSWRLSPDLSHHPVTPNANSTACNDLLLREPLIL